MDSYNWIIDDLVKSIVLILMHNREEKIGSFEADSLVDSVGNKILVSGDNINDLLNLINSSYVRFKINKLDIDDTLDCYIDIPLRNLPILYNSADIIMFQKDKIILNNSIISIPELEAFSIIDGFLLGDNYGVKAVSFYDSIEVVSSELDKLFNIIVEFPKLSMEDRYYKLHELYNLNKKRKMVDLGKYNRI